MIKSDPSRRRDVDVVYLWLDEADSRAAVELAQALKGRGEPVEPEAVGTHRFRDRGELRFSLRSVFRHAPWVRRIHIVSGSRAPAWLDTNHPQIQFVPHAAVFPSSSTLPTFNSFAIETVLHRIPGLSEYFIYLNDDFFLGRAVDAGDFFADGKPCLLRQRGRIERGTTPTSGLVYRIIDHSLKLLEERTGPLPPQFQPLHACYFMQKEGLREVLDTFADAARVTRSHAFRTPSDLSVIDLYTVYHGYVNPGLYHEVVYDFASPDFAFIKLDDQKLRTGIRELLGTRLRRSRFYCINDDARRPGGPRDRLLSGLMRLFLWTNYPRRAPWEVG